MHKLPRLCGGVQRGWRREGRALRPARRPRRNKKTSPLASSKG
ncbi:hypothetical protein HMPREF0262_01623 [Clostridium sp. ATCC 29733]|nr:hypothetical protein HMPREF0262_01623 [Clostridium sp. ATCC 29733]